MQFKRKATDQNGSKLGLRVAIFTVGVVLIIILFNIYDDGYGDGSSGSGYVSSMLRGESPDDNDQPLQDVIKKESDDHIEEINSRKIASPSLLNSPDAIKNLPACVAVRHEDISSTTKFDKTLPALFSGWDAPAIHKWADRKKFQSSFGMFNQYIKGIDVQPLKDEQGKQCQASTHSLIDAMEKLFHKKNPSFGKGGGGASAAANTNNDNQDLLFFTNDKENPTFLEALSSDYSVPPPIANIDAFSSGFKVFSAMERGSSHPFHFHDASWLGQVSGSRLWFFLPPDTPKRVVGKKVNGCEYLLGQAPLPKGATACVQSQGEVMYFPKDWLHATCALEPWSVGIGGQAGNLRVYNQQFDLLQQQSDSSAAEEKKNMISCGVFDENDFASSQSTEIGVTNNGKDEPTTQSDIATADKEGQDWTWYDGDLNAYYNKLEKDEHAKRDPNKITSYAVHRWMGRHSTLVHYGLVREAIYDLVIGQHAPENQGHSTAPNSNLRVFDAGCGLGAGLMWFEQHEPSWQLIGHTISEDQWKWIVEDLPKHNFVANLRTYDEPLGDSNVSPFHVAYSIEAAVHSPNLKNSLQAWSKAILPGGVIVIIDDFLSVGVPRDDPDVDLFAKSWIANAVHSTTEIAGWANEMGMSLVRDRDLGSEYQIIKHNYRNKAPVLRDEHGRAHQGWLGSKVRQKLMVEGKITYRLIVLQKDGSTKIEASTQPHACEASVPMAHNGESALSITIDPILMTGKGKKGGQQMSCISGWYCCDKGTELWDELNQKRTERTGFLKLPRELFGHYLTSFSKHLTDFYQTFPVNYPGGKEKGVFLDIGGTGSVAAGMTQVTSKFANFAGPLDYWVLDSDQDAKKLNNAVVCDIDDCQEAADCAYDVTFSHTVLEHAARPWKAFDTIARITKKGGLTLHLVPWSYQYHATPDDNYRFSHKALTSLLEDRGFEVLDVGYDVCTQPEHMLKNRKDEHFETIWLTYVVGRKL